MFSPPVWLNLPPARVWTYRAADTEGSEIDVPSRDVLLRLKEGTDKLGEEWREKRRRLHDVFIIRAEKARHEFKLRTEKLKVGIERHQSLLQDGHNGKLAVDLFERTKASKKTPRW